MKKHIHKAALSSLTVICIILAGAATSFSQTVRLKSNSEKHLRVVLTGVNREGKEVTRTIEDVGIGYWKNISLYKTKYGYELYNNKHMKMSGADGTNRWKKMVITDENGSATDELDITESIDEKKLTNTHLWVKVVKDYDNDYLVSRVTFYDHRKKKSEDPWYRR